MKIQKVIKRLIIICLCLGIAGLLIKEGGEPSHMLRDRLQRGVEVYQYGASEKLLMSGDHGRTEYNEVETMKQYAIDEGIESENIFMDHAGFSTYESIYRAKDFVTTIIKPEPTYLGDFIDIHGDGNVTND